LNDVLRSVILGKISNFLIWKLPTLRTKNGIKISFGLGQAYILKQKSKYT